TGTKGDTAFPGIVIQIPVGTSCPTGFTLQLTAAGTAVKSKKGIADFIPSTGSNAGANFCSLDTASTFVYVDKIAGSDACPSGYTAAVISGSTTTDACYK